MSEVSNPLAEQVLIEQIAQARSIGTSIANIAKQLNVTEYQVKKILNNPEYKTLINEAAEREVFAGKTYVKGFGQQLAEEAVRVLMKKLKEDDLEAAKTVLRVLGLEKEEKVVADTSIQVVLPGVSEQVISTTGESL